MGITRAKQRLSLSSAKSRIVNGELRFHRESPFLAEIPEELIERQKSARINDDPLPASGAHRSSSYSGQPKPAAFGKIFQVEHMKTLPYEVGDRVRHARFGVGSVLEIKDGKQDFEVTVEFDELGRRKMLAGFAKLEKLTS